MIDEICSPLSEIDADIWDQEEDYLAQQQDDMNDYYYSEVYKDNGVTVGYSAHKATVYFNGSKYQAIIYGFKYIEIYENPKATGHIKLIFEGEVDDCDRLFCDIDPAIKKIKYCSNEMINNAVDRILKLKLML